MDAPDTDDEGKSTLRPSPTDFDVFLAWACNALQVQQPLVVSKIVQNDYISVIGLSTSKSKRKKSKISKVDITPSVAKEESFALPKAMLSELEPGIQVLAFYDVTENVVKLHFEKNRTLPQMVFKIIGLIIKFHPYLHTISIKGGLNKECVYEISKFLPFSKITDLCLDTAFIAQANYHLLLEHVTSLRHLSLARCSISDAVVEEIAATLSYPLPASRTLCILNLASNRITDAGAKYLAEIMRSNRRLCYLNLSDNMITDAGAGHLLDTLAKFPLSFGELLAARSRHMTYLKEKNEMIIRIVKELRTGDFEKRAAKRKSLSASRPATNSKKKGLEKETSVRSMPESKSIPAVEGLFIEKATAMAENALGEFSDPFDKENTVAVDGIVYSMGNNSLAYVSLAYNNLSFVTVKRLLNVLLYQKESSRKPRGLINVSIEGNLMPKTCKELLQIDDLLKTGLMMHSSRYSLPKKRLQSKTGSAR